MYHIQQRIRVKWTLTESTYVSVISVITYLFYILQVIWVMVCFNPLSLISWLLFEVLISLNHFEQSIICFVQAIFYSVTWLNFWWSTKKKMTMTYLKVCQLRVSKDKFIWWLQITFRIFLFMNLMEMMTSICIKSWRKYTIQELDYVRLTIILVSLDNCS